MMGWSGCLPPQEDGAYVATCNLQPPSTATSHHSFWPEATVTCRPSLHSSLTHTAAFPLTSFRCGTGHSPCGCNHIAAVDNDVVSCESSSHPPRVGNRIGLLPRCSRRSRSRVLRFISFLSRFSASEAKRLFRKSITVSSTHPTITNHFDERRGCARRRVR